ncbi:MAG: peptidylprolyl isomerase [Rhizobium sp.]|nr:peptidylprolyl isomerase [Rhizobium sp.]
MFPNMTKLRSLIVGVASLVLAATVIPQAAIAASEQIKAVVNGTVVTSGDVVKRVNFLKLRRTPGNLQKVATEELVNEVLMRSEIIRTGFSVSTDDVDAAFARFATNNKMSVAQLSSIMEKAGITVAHFKSYIGVQMSWPRVVQARYGTGGSRMTQSQFVARLKQDNGQKPKTNEYILQQVIFVVPESKRNKIMGKRKSEAEASRKSYPGCVQAKIFAATMRDVSIRDIGRVLEPQLPDQWKDSVLKTPVGGTTPAQVTERGVEYLSVCKKREVSDDFAAQIMYEARDLEKVEKDAENPDSKKFMDELRKNAQIEIR